MKQRKKTKDTKFHKALKLVSTDKLLLSHGMSMNKKKMKKYQKMIYSLNSR